MAAGLTKFQGACLSFNFVMGCGFLGLPLVYVESGWFLGTGLAILAGILLMLTTLLDCETILRCSHMVHSAKHQCASGIKHVSTAVADKESELPLYADRAICVSDRYNAIPDLKYKIVGEEIGFNEAMSFTSSRRTLEMTEVFEVLLSQRAKIGYCLFLTLYQICTLWSYATVFAEAAARLIPLPFMNEGHACDLYEMNTESEAGCMAVYWSWLGIFTCLVLPLSVLEPAEQVGFQVFMSGLRIFVVGLMLVSVVAASIYPFNGDIASSEGRTVFWFGEDIAKERDESGPVPMFRRGSSIFTTFSVIVFSQLLNAQVGIVVASVQNKKDVGNCVLYGMAACTCFYVLFSILIALYFADAIDGSCNVSWGSFALVPVRWLIVGFPGLDVLSVFPMNVIVVANNLMALVYPDAASLSRALSSFWSRSAWRAVVVLPAICLALVWWDLHRILAFTGVIGMLLGFVLPTAMYSLSLARYKDTFGPTAPLSGPIFLHEWMTKEWILRIIFGLGVTCSVLAFVKTVKIDFGLGDA